MMDIEKLYDQMIEYFHFNGDLNRIHYFRKMVDEIKAEALEEAYNDGIAIPAEDD